jgi:L-threonylcarbamoyladenylate synthase
VYGLGANLDDPQAIQELYQVKERPFRKQVTLHIADPSDLKRYDLEISAMAGELMERFWPGPLTLVLKRRDGSTLGFRMPKHPVALALLSQARVPVVAPSANLSGNPPPRTAQEVLRDLSDKIDILLDGGPTPGGLESTVLDLSGERPQILRRGAIGDEIEKVLAG